MNHHLRHIQGFTSITRRSALTSQEQHRRNSILGAVINGKGFKSVLCTELLELAEETAKDLYDRGVRKMSTSAWHSAVDVMMWKMSEIDGEFPHSSANLPAVEFVDYCSSRRREKARTAWQLLLDRAAADWDRLKIETAKRSRGKIIMWANRQTDLRPRWGAKALLMVMWRVWLEKTAPPAGQTGSKDWQDLAAGYRGRARTEAFGAQIQKLIREAEVNGTSLATDIQELCQGYAFMFADEDPRIGKLCTPIVGMTGCLVHHTTQAGHRRFEFLAIADTGICDHFAGEFVELKLNVGSMTEPDQILAALGNKFRAVREQYTISSFSEQGWLEHTVAVICEAGMLLPE